MQYSGGKHRLAKELSRYMLENRADKTVYVEPFLGAASVAVQMVHNFSESQLSDAMPDLMLLWQALQNGWEPPDVVSEEEYQLLRGSEPSALRGFAGFACSFGGKWFGGYARDYRTDVNYAAVGKRGLAKKVTMLSSSQLLLRGYDEVTATPSMLIYCDPPYANTLGYATGRFDSAKFWQTAESWVSAGALVYVSEFTAPEPWQAVWQHRSTVMTGNVHQEKVEKLFAPLK